MHFLSIDTKGCMEDMEAHIRSKLLELDAGIVKYSVDRSEFDGEIAVSCSLESEEANEKYSSSIPHILKSNLSYVLADYIINKYEVKLTYRVICSNYCYFNSVEKKQILQHALNILKNDEKLLGSIFLIKRKNLIAKKIMEYFDSNYNIMLEGFVNFRLKDYMQTLDDIVDKAVNNYLMEREYTEFIRLLRYFVNLQEPKYEKLHIINENGAYRILDDKFREILSENDSIPSPKIKGKPERYERFKSSDYTDIYNNAGCSTDFNTNDNDSANDNANSKENSKSINKVNSRENSKSINKANSREISKSNSKVNSREISKSNSKVNSREISKSNSKANSRENTKSNSKANKIEKSKTNDYESKKVEDKENNNSVYNANNKVNIKAIDNSKYKVTNKVNTDAINSETKNECELTKADLLVSNLISVAPRRLIIHCPEDFANKELMETIKSVFSERLEICTGCKICKKIYFTC